MSESTFKYHAVIMPDDPDKGGPVKLCSNDEAGFFSDLNKRLVEIKKGWCHLIIDGAACQLSEPRMFFTVKMPDGAMKTFGDATAASFSQDGSFSLPD